MDDLPDEWKDALAAAAEKQRILVLGATDVGKSAFIRAYSAVRPAAIIDLDPGQKLIGPPGTASLGSLNPERVERFIFLGSTSASSIGAIARAGAALAGEASGAFIVNTSGFVTGPGARLQALTAGSIRPDLIVEIAREAGPAIVTAEGLTYLRISPSPVARRKSPSARAAIRQRAFDTALAGAATMRLTDVAFHPTPPALAAAPIAEARPVCALADAEGSDMRIGVLRGQEDGALLVQAMAVERPVALVRLGRMWAVPDAGGWRLLDKLVPGWTA